MTQSKKFEQAFEDWPEMKLLPEENAVLIKGAYKPPSKFWETTFPGLMVFITIGLTLFFIGLADNAYGGNDNIPDNLGNMIIFGFPAFMIIFTVWCRRVGRTRHLHIKVSLDAVEVGGKRYSRNAPRQYSVETHEKALGEEIEATKKKVERTFRDAIQVVMHYGEKRIAIADFGHKDANKARSLLRRLQGLDIEKGLEILVQNTQQGNNEPAPPDHDDFGPSQDVR